MWGLSMSTATLCGVWACLSSWWWLAPEFALIALAVLTDINKETAT